MATVEHRSGQLTFGDFLAIMEDHQKADLLDGAIYIASPESTDDNALAGWLYRLMSEYAEARDLGRVFFTRVAFRITEKRGPEPDVAFVTKRRKRLIKAGYVDGPPDIAVEIVSPDSVHRDYVLKRSIYEKAGVKEYWIIDPAKRQLTLLRRHGTKFREVETSDILESTILRGLKLEVRWLWTKRRPAVSRVLQDLLSE